MPISTIGMRLRHRLLHTCTVGVVHLCLTQGLFTLRAYSRVSVTPSTQKSSISLFVRSLSRNIPEHWVAAWRSGNVVGLDQRD